mmetsp:Transcript_44592/g.101317  ORF Transcript_44592/g.101317 Transcript_44592/m.101317 type:complete len:388 (-) Transcript_44592:149-1312(-)
MRDRVESFDRMRLHEDLLRGIYSYGFEEPSEIQQRIGLILAGQNLIARAECGTGKTAAFAIGVLQLVDCSLAATQALILAPGREQALQIHHVLQCLGEYLGARCHVCIGGTSVRDDIDALWQAPHIVVGTVGRVADMSAKGHLDTRCMKVLVLDDADVLMHSSFRAVKDIRRSLPRSLQLCFFSATFPPEELARACQLCDSSKRETSHVGGGTAMPAALHHFYVDLESEEWKVDVLADLCLSPKGQTIVFCNTARMVDFLTDQLHRRDVVVSCFHAELDQKERDLVMREFRSGQARTLIATDLLERSIDVQQVNVVINCDLPLRADSYLHRAARAGRFHRPGVVISLKVAGSGDEAALHDFSSHFQIPIQELPMYFDDLLERRPASF